MASKPPLNQRAPAADSSQQPKILIVGYGDLGRAIGRMLAAAGLSVLGLRRSECPHEDSIAMMSGDVTQPDTLAQLKQADPHILLYCVAATGQSDENYRAHYVEGLRHVLAALGQAGNLQHVFFVSSSRVYGQGSDAPMNEADPALPCDFGGQRLLQAEQLLASLPCGHTALRLSGIYGPGRHRMLGLAGDSTRWPENTWSNRIHRDDAAGFVVFLIQRALNGLMLEHCYIVTDSRPVPQHEVLLWLAGRMGHDADQIQPAAPCSGKRLSNARMLATGFQLRYPDYQAGYAELIASENLE